MTTLHKGRVWNIYNPGRFLTNYYSMTSYPPTAMKWQVDNWSGILGAGAVTGGYDMLPELAPDGSAVWYRKTLFGVLGGSFELRLEFSPDTFFFPNASGNQIRVRVLQGGGDQITGATYAWAGTNVWVFSFIRTAGYNVAVDAVAFPSNSVLIKPVTWFDGVPVPPSTPF
jgi:hypothetical protein